MKRYHLHMKYSEYWRKTLPLKERQQKWKSIIFTWSNLSRKWKGTIFTLSNLSWKGENTIWMVGSIRNLIHVVRVDLFLLAVTCVVTSLILLVFYANSNHIWQLLCSIKWKDRSEWFTLTFLLVVIFFSLKCWYCVESWMSLSCNANL